MNIKPEVLDTLISRLEEDDRSRPQTDEEKQVYQMINDLDHVAHHVQGSATNKKYMRNEIWSLIIWLGAPSWFITFSPTDIKHPIALYFADADVHIYPKVLTHSERYRLIANNPIAGARFFKVMVELFIKHVLGVGSGHPGLYGKTSGYYGTVEQ
ncbi:hypothetical protein FA95DRAFT_1476081, partial [Auriscalpium vulgare]